MPSGIPAPLSERFWEHVNKNGPMGYNHKGRKIGKCHEWTAYRNPGGYGQVGLEENNASGKRKQGLAHRVRWFLEYGVWPEGHLDHLCRNRACVRLSHLEDVSQVENNRRSPRPRTSVCPKGHELTEDNLYTRVKNGTVQRVGCKTCIKQRAADRRKKLSEMS